MSSFERVNTVLPSGAQDRKNIPLFWGLVNYFRDALIAVAKLSMIGNEQHCPGEPLRWDRTKGGDELDAQMRHLFQIGGIDWQKVPHSVRNAWRALATCQIELEETPWDTPVSEIVELIRERRESASQQCSRRPMTHMGRPDAPTPPDQAFAGCQVVVLQHIIQIGPNNLQIDRLKAFGPFSGMPEANYFAKSLRANSDAPVSFVTLSDVSKLRTRKC